MKRLLSVILGCILSASVFACAVFAFSPARSVSANSYYDEEQGDYYIDTNWWFERVDVQIDVRKDKTFAIREIIKVGFIRGGENTGIIRDIQRISLTTRVIDGKKESGERYLANLSDVEVTIDGKPAKVTQGYYSNGEFFSVKMQKADQSYFEATDQSAEEKNEAAGYHDFALSYVYDMSEDKVSGYDDFTFDVLGYAMSFTRTFTAVVTFPEGTELSAKNVTFRTNEKKPWLPSATSGEGYAFDGNQISLQAKPMSENKGYTVQVILPDGYFELSGGLYFWYYWLFFAAALAALAGIGVLFYLYCPRKPVEQVELAPPKDIRVMRASAIWYGNARENDAAAVIAQWADDGYVKIVQDGKKDLILFKLKNISDSAEEEEKSYFNAVFPNNENGDVFSTKEMRKSTNFLSKYNRSYYMHLALRGLTARANVPDPLKKGNGLAHFLMTVFALVPFLMTVIYCCILSLTALPLFFFVFITAGTIVGSLQARSFMTGIAYIFPVAFTALPCGVLYGLFYMSRYDYAGLFWLAIAIWALGLVLLHFLKRRTPEAERQLGLLRGFKRFILTAELDRIEMLFNEDPDYFSHIIPYCLMMKIGDKVMKRYSSLQLSMPDWMRNVSVVGFSSFSRTLSSSSGGGSHGGGGGGGGSSGGGGGGGGSRGC